jgi:hypothetical protein
MESTDSDINDLLGFLNPETRLDVLILTLQHVNEAIDSVPFPSWISKRGLDLVQQLMKLLKSPSTPSQLHAVVWRILVNLAGTEDSKLLQEIASNHDIIGRVSDCAFTNNPHRTRAVEVISNMTRQPLSCQSVWDSLSRDSNDLTFLTVLVRHFVGEQSQEDDVNASEWSTTGTSSNSCKSSSHPPNAADNRLGDISGFCLRNLSQLVDVRRALTFGRASAQHNRGRPHDELSLSSSSSPPPLDHSALHTPIPTVSQTAQEVSTECGSTTNFGLLVKILPMIRHERVLRRSSAVDIVKNCCFDTELHASILALPDIIVHILRPLIGPEPLNEDENDTFPVDLQYMEPSKEREQVTSIRSSLLQTLYQLCSTQCGREFLRRNGAYYVLRELHKCEKNEEVLLYCENVVGVLIRDEDEIGFDNLKELGDSGDDCATKGTKVVEIQ